VGEQQQAAAASHPELSRPHVHGEAEDGTTGAPKRRRLSGHNSGHGEDGAAAAASSSSAAADAPSTGASSPARGSVEMLGEDGAAAAASASPDHAAAPAAGSTAAAPPPPAGVKLPYKKEIAALREEIHYFLALAVPVPEPLMLDDDSTFRQMAVAIQNIRGTKMDLANLSGADALRLVLPDGTNIGKGKIGLYRAGVEFLRVNVNVQQQQ